MISVKDLHKTYGQGIMATQALKGISLEIEQGEFVAVMGRSGSGKSTLLHILGLLDKPSRGEVRIDGHDIVRLTEEQKTSFRLDKLGYVFQEYSLVPEMNIMENVYLPALCQGTANNYKKLATEMLETVGLGHRLNHYPNEISGGEQQRVAIARALINHPKILFADEPTASLDITSARTVLELFRKLNRELGQTIVMVTHEPEDEKCVDRVIWLKDGLIAESLHHTSTPR
jgi:putative ABC transport system ATP-binding protein